jgi:hypothetical protein
MSDLLEVDRTADMARDFRPRAKVLAVAILDANWVTIGHRENMAKGRE